MSFSCILSEYSNEISDIVIYFCMLYTAASLCSGLILHFLMNKQWVTAPIKSTIKISPIIKPENYQDGNILLRKSLNAINWSLVANKARALHNIRGNTDSKSKLRPSSASFTFGQREYYV